MLDKIKQLNDLCGEIEKDFRTAYALGTIDESELKILRLWVLHRQKPEDIAKPLSFAPATVRAKYSIAIGKLEG